MTMPNEFGQADYSDGNTGDSGSEGGMNPNWNPILSEIPQDLHSRIVPHLRNWDQGVQSRFQEQAAWKPVMQSNMSPEMVQQAIQLARSMQEDPRGVYDAMGQHYNFAQAVQQAVQTAQAAADDDDPYAPKFNDYESRLNEIRGQNEVMAKAIYAQYQEKERTRKEQEEDAALDKELSVAAQKFGPSWNEQVALRLMQGFDSPQEAMEFYLQGNKQNQPAPYAPRVMGSGSSFPHLGNKRPGQMNDNEQQNLVANMLMDAMRANQQ